MKSQRVLGRRSFAVRHTRSVCRVESATTRVWLVFTSAMRKQIRALAALALTMPSAAFGQARPGPGAMRARKTQMSDHPIGELVAPETCEDQVETNLLSVTIRSFASR